MNELHFFCRGLPQTQGNKTGFAIKKFGQYTGEVAMVEGRRPKSRAAFESWRLSVCIDSRNERVRTGWQTADEPVEVTMVFYLPKPKNPEWPVPATGLDLDKLIRAVFDGMKEGGIYVNDSRVVSLPNSPRKLYEDEDHPPGVYVTVRKGLYERCKKKRK